MTNFAVCKGSKKQYRRPPMGIHQRILSYLLLLVSIPKGSALQMRNLTATV